MAPGSNNTDYRHHSRLGPANPTPTAMLSPAERVTEIAEILAAGLMRLVASKSTPNSADTGDSLLDFSPSESGHPAQLRRRTSDG